MLEPTSHQEGRNGDDDADANKFISINCFQMIEEGKQISNPFVGFCTFFQVAK